MPRSRSALAEPALPLFAVNTASPVPLPAPPQAGPPSGPPLPDAAQRVARTLPSYLRDHRKRLRARFLEGGAQAMPDYELLELLLFRAIPRQDVKPLARRLLDAFGDLAAVISAPPARLSRVDGVGEAVIVELKLAEAMQPACRAPGC